MSLGWRVQPIPSRCRILGRDAGLDPQQVDEVWRRLARQAGGSERVREELFELELDRLGPRQPRVTEELAPGKRTLTRQLPPAGGDRLPHQALMETAFEADFSAVEVRTGEREAMADLGARAAAEGNKITFAETSPEPWLVAHELAHVMQHRNAGGVACTVARKATIAAVDSAAEREADRVADRVARGHQAGPIRERPVADLHRAPSQRATPETLWNRFLASHHRELFQTLHDRLAERNLRQLAIDLRTNIENNADDYLTKLDSWSQPGSLRAQLLALGEPPASWDAAIGMIIAIAFERALDDSLARMARQLQIVVDQRPHHDHPPAGSLVPTYPIDLVVGPFVVARPGAFGASHRAVPPDAQSQMYARGPIGVTYKWLGQHDPSLWNWIEVGGPPNATVEDVAHTPFVGHVIDEGQWAYRIAARSPYFGIPVDIARQVGEAWSLAPKEVKDAGAGRDEVVATAALDRSDRSDALALAQAPGHEPGTSAADEILSGNQLQLGYLAARLADCHAVEPLASAWAFLGRRQGERGTPKLASWETVLRQQQVMLRIVAAAIDELGAPDPRATGKADPRVVSAPLHELIVAFAHVAGISHLAADAAAALAETNHQRARLPLAYAEEQVRGAVALGFASPDEARAQAEEASHIDDPQITPVDTATLLARAAAIRQGAGTRGAFDPEAVAHLEVDAASFQLTADLRRTRDLLRQVVAQAAEVGITNEWESDQPTILALPKAAVPLFEKWVRTLEAPHANMTANARRSVITDISAASTAWKQKTELKQWFVDANATITNERLRNLFLDLAKQLAIAVGTAQVASGIVSVARGAVTASELLAALREADLVLEGMELLIQTGLQTGLEHLDGHGGAKRDFAENLLTGALASLALRPFRGLLGKVKGLEHDLRTAAQKAGHLGVELALDFGAGAVAGDFSHRLAHDAEATSMRDGWVQQLVGLGVMKFVGARTAAMHKRLARAVAGQGDPELMVLRAAVTKLEERARKAAPDEALDALIEQHALVLRELAFYQTHGHNDEQAKLAAAEAGSPDAELADAPLRLAKLAPLVDGHAYQGRPADVQRALDGVRAAFPDAVVTFDPATGVWHIAIGKRSFLVYEVGHQRRAEHAASPPAHPAETEHVTAPASATVVLAGDDAALRAAAQRAQPRPGYIDVVVHGDAESFWVAHDGVNVALDHRAFAKYLTKRGLAGKRLRLIACQAGASPFAIAQRLASKLKVEVLAPDQTAWINDAGYVGVGPKDQDSGKWHTFEDKGKDNPRPPKPEPYVEPEPLKVPDGSEYDPPTAVEVPRVDQRQHVTPAHLPDLSAQLGVKVTIDAGLYNGVEVHARRSRGLFGYDLNVVEIRVGIAAPIGDVLAHARTLADLRRYNGVLGKLRYLRDRVWKGRQDAKPRYAPGSLGHVTEIELAKLDALIEERRTSDAGELVDRATLDEEIAFFEGEVARHREVVDSMVDVGDLAGEDGVVVAAPDVLRSTREALAAGYKRPGELPGVGAGENPDDYYYRHSKHDPSVFELARRPTASASGRAAYRAEVVAGKFVQLVPWTRPKAEIVEIGTSHEALMTRLRGMEGFGPYEAMLLEAELATRKAVEMEVQSERNRRNQAGHEVTLDALRHAVKEYFRPRVLAYLTNSKLTAAESYQRMRGMLDKLGVADRGPLAEAWYRARYAPNAKPQVRYAVDRTTGDNARLREFRTADLVEGREACEIKDVTGAIDEEQFNAYVDMIRAPGDAAAKPFDRLRYAFTNPKGAIANLEFLAKKLEGEQLRDRLTVEVIDGQGQRHVVTTSQQARQLLLTLAPKGKHT